VPSRRSRARGRRGRAVGRPADRRPLEPASSMRYGRGLREGGPWARIPGTAFDGRFAYSTPRRGRAAPQAALRAHPGKSPTHRLPSLDDPQAPAVRPQDTVELVYRAALDEYGAPGPAAGDGVAGAARGAAGRPCVLNSRAFRHPDRSAHGNESDPPLPRGPRAALHGAQGVPLTTSPQRAPDRGAPRARGSGIWNDPSAPGTRRERTRLEGVVAARPLKSASASRRAARARRGRRRCRHGGSVQQDVGRLESEVRASSSAHVSRRMDSHNCFLDIQAGAAAPSADWRRC